MTYLLAWYLKPRIIRIQYFGNITLGEMQVAFTELQGMVQNCPEQVYTLIDMTFATQLPMDMRGLRNVFSSKLHPMQGPALMYGHNMVFDIILQTIVKITNIPIYSVRDLEAALVWLRARDSSLEQLLDHR